MLTYGNPLCGIRRLCWATLLAFLVIAPGVVRSQGNVPPSLPPAAQEALNKGVVAAKVPDYLLAIRYFEEARKLAPQAPVIYLNLGLAESKIPGRELRAMAWFGAYLAANPTAPNAAAVREQITVLQVKNQSNVLRLLKTVQDAAMAVPDRENPPGIVMSFRQGGSLHDAAVLWARSGDTTVALQTAARIQAPQWRGWAQGAVGLARFESGDVVGARECFFLALRTSERDQDTKSNTKSRVAEAQAQMGDIQDALKTAESIQDPWASVFAKSLIANAQIEAGDRAGARQVLGTALPIIDRIRDAKEKIDVLLVVAMAQARAGDGSAALRTIDRAAEKSWKNRVQEVIEVTVVALQAESGDIVGALQAADRLNKEKDKGSALQAIALAQARTADFAGARKTADLIKDPYEKHWADIGIVKAQTRANLGTPIPAEDWIAKNSKELKASIYLDPVEALKTLPAQNPQQTFAAFRDAAADLIEKQQMIDRMLRAPR